jgi:hypothetical protein
MVKYCFLFGAMLAMLGYVGYTEAVPNPETGEKSPTALIPAMLGGVLILCGLIVALKANLRKHVMHVAALVGVLGVLGGFMPVYRQTVVKNLPFSIDAPAVRNGLLMSLVCGLFVFFCVRSFIEARKARQSISS